MPTLNDVLAGSQAQAVQVQQIIDALKGTPNKGVPVALVSLNDPSNYALTVQNDDPVNSRALSVLKADGTTLISADATGVTLGAPVNVPAGALNGTQLANASVSNAKLGPDVARASQLTNGGFEIWQRGNGPFTFTQWAADGWLTSGVGGDTISISRDTSNVDIGSGACAAVTFTKASGTTALTQTSSLKEAGSSLVGKPVSFSMRVRTATANAVRIGIYNGSAWTYSAYHPGGGTYQTLTVANVTLNSTGAQVAVWFDVTCTAYLDNGMLVVGSQPCDYVPLHPADDLARCLRYYQIHCAGTEWDWSASGAHILGFGYQALPPLAVTPTVTKVGTWTTVNCNQPTVTPGVANNFRLYVTAAAAGAVALATTAAMFVTVEGNP